MKDDLATVLDDSLERIARGETLQACLLRYPAQSAELETLLFTAARLEDAVQVNPSAAFKSYAWTQLRTYMAAHPRQHSL